MRQKYSQRLGLKLRAAFVVLVASSCVLAQGSDGRTETIKPAPVTRSKPKIAKTSFQTTVSKPKPAVHKPGTLFISINETESVIHLMRTDELSVPPQPVIIANDGRQIVRSLDPGLYQIRVKKNGYFDETHDLEISPGRLRRLNVTLRPQMAMLSIKTNLSDAEMDIENAGKFTKPLKRHLLMPGAYRIALRRPGYASQTVTADLSVAGKEQSIYVVLEPLRIESVLWTANKAIERSELDAAAGLVDDVLQLNPKHAKANSLRGLIELRRGSENADSYFLQAVDGGETVSLPMCVVHAGQLVEIDLRIDRNSMSFENDKYLDLNLRISRSELDELSRSVDHDGTTYLIVRGRSDFYGKPIRPEIRLYSDYAAQNSGPRSKSSNSTEVEVLNKFFSNWRNHTVR